MKVYFVFCIVTILATACNNSETTSSKKKVRQLKEFSRKDLYEELSARKLDSQKQTTDTTYFVGDTTKPIIRYDELKYYTSQEIFNEIKMQESKMYGIYGNDDRKEIFNLTDTSILKNAEGVVAFFRKDQLTDNRNGTYSVKTYTLFRNIVEPALCDNEPFCKQPSICNCTGFAISKNVIASAGHCLQDSEDLKNWVFVFDYHMKNDTTAEVTFKKKDVLHPAKIIKQKHDENTDEDYLLIKIKESIPQGRILKYDTTNLYTSMPVYVVGHPCGLPMKYAGNAVVRDNSPSNYFIANVDTYGGNSGSPIFNARNNKVIGILVRGGKDFEELGECQQSKVCPDDSCRGEDVTRISSIIKYISQK